MTRQDPVAKESRARGDVTERRPTVVVITGLSGAGKSTALHALEDLGFFCVDNLPTALATPAVELCEKGGMYHVALGMDVRVRAFLGAVGTTLAALEAGGQRDVHVVFLDASDETLLRRFSETRRPHPHGAAHSAAAPSAALALLDELNLERERLARLRARATRVIDTTALSVHELRRAILDQFGAASGSALRMNTRIISFGYKYGTPADADLVFDVRFLTNPYFIAELKPLAGTDRAVSDFVMSLPEARELFSKIVDFLTFVIPKYEREGKSYLTIAIGCTGGRHRSVALAEAVAATVSYAVSSPLQAVHRDVFRGTGTVPPRSATPSSAGER
jgi:RNase adapter protein RapZ